MHSHRCPYVCFGSTVHYAFSFCSTVLLPPYSCQSRFLTLPNAQPPRLSPRLYTALFTIVPPDPEKRINLFPHTPSAPTFNPSSPPSPRNPTTILRAILSIFSGWLGWIHLPPSGPAALCFLMVCSCTPHFAYLSRPSWPLPYSPARFFILTINIYVRFFRRVGQQVILRGALV